MSSPPFRVEPQDEHARTHFDCGVSALNEYFAARAGQDVRRRVSFCFVAVETASGISAGYYTLAACGIALGDLPPKIAKRLPRYPMVPAARIGRLAVDRRFQGRKLGSALLYDAVERVQRSDIAAFALIVDAKDDQAVAFHEHFGFERFNARKRTLFLPTGEALQRQRVRAP